MRDNKTWFWYKKIPLDVKKCTWEGMIVLAIALCSLIWLGVNTLDGSENLFKSVAGILWLCVIIVLLHIVIKSKGKKLQ